MKNKSIILIGITIIASLAIFFSCQKIEKNQVEDQDTEIALIDANFSPDFDWETARNITINISSSTSQIVNITSADGIVRYHKGKHPGNSETYTIRISVPTSISLLRINNQEISLNSENFDINL